MVLHLLSSTFQGVLAGTLLVAAVSIGLKLYGSTSASTRFAIWWACLLTAAGLTFAPLAMHPAETSEPVTVRPAPSAAVSTPLPVNEKESAAAPVQDVSWRVPVDPDVPEALLAVYCVTVGFLLFRLLAGYFRVVRLRRACKPAPPELRERFENWLKESDCRRSVELLVSTRSRCPIAVGLGRPAVIIPESLLLDLTAEQLDHIALHELAHLRRFDDWNTLAQRLMRALFFFHPGIHWACRRLDFEREIACDDSVLSSMDAPKQYAESLTRVAELAQWRRTPILASGAVFRKRAIFRRVKVLLDTARDRRPRISQMSMAVVLLLIFGIASELAKLPSVVAMVDGNSYHRSTWSSDGRKVEMEIAGDIRFADDDATVAHVPDSGFLRIEECSGWSCKSVEYRADSVRYRVNGNERPLDEAARSWVATVLPKIIREQGFDAEERAARILTQGGADALLREIDRISSDHSRSRYLTAAIESRKLEAEELRLAAQRIRRIGSDHDKANLLIQARDVYFSAGLQPAWFDAADTISSDHDRRRTMLDAIDRASVDGPTLVLAARVTQRMSSDHDKAEVLKESATELMRNDEVRTAVLRAVDSIGSDHDRARVLKKFLHARDTSAAEVDSYCRSVARIGSDHDKKVLLVDAAPRLTPACMEAVRSIGSDGDRREVLSRVLKSEAPADTAVAALELAAKLPVDEDRSALASMAAEHYSDDSVRDAIRKVKVERE
jgi:beta-lactamase regulating signal transducer with metallopeptidase domain